jgi:cytochrome c oxidase subunit III
MAATIQPPELEKHDLPADDDQSGGGGVNGLGPTTGNPRMIDDFSPDPSRTGIWVGLAAISMSFAAFTSALVVRQATANDWHRLTIPSIVFVNTVILLASSVTLEVARRSVADYARNKSFYRTASLFWLSGTLVLGLLFVIGQYLAWRQLRAEGLYLASNPNSSFFYLLTAMHALHVLGGLVGLLRLIYLVRQPLFSLRRSTMDATSYYWHFLGVLWLYVLLVMWIKL